MTHYKNNNEITIIIKLSIYQIIRLLDYYL